MYESGSKLTKISTVLHASLMLVFLTLVLVLTLATSLTQQLDLTDQLTQMDTGCIYGGKGTREGTQTVFSS